MFHLNKNDFRGMAFSLPLNNNKGTCQFYCLMTRKTWLYLPLLFLLFAASGCEKKSKNVPIPNGQKKVMSTQQEEITDNVGRNELFEERKALWLKKMPTHYRLSFAFICDCPYRTTQLQDIKKDGKVSVDAGGNFLTVEVKDGKVIEIHKENGEQVPIKEYRSDRLQSDILEYSWYIGKNESYGYKLISEPINFLWVRTQEAIKSSPQKKIILTYDKQFGFIKKIDFSSSIPDSYFQGEVKDFTPLR